MDSLVVGLGGLLVLALLGMFAVAFRRSSAATSDWRDELQPEAIKADRGGVETVVLSQEEGEDVPEGDLLIDTDEAEELVPPARAVQVQTINEISTEEAGANRRQFFGKAWAMLFFAYLGTLGLSSLAMMWPVVKGGFGADIDLGDIDELLERIRLPDGSVSPLFSAEARAWIIPVNPEEAAGSQFEENSTVVGGISVLDMRCEVIGE